MLLKWTIIPVLLLSAMTTNAEDTKAGFQLRGKIEGHFRNKIHGDHQTYYEFVYNQGVPLGFVLEPLTPYTADVTQETLVLEKLDLEKREPDRPDLDKLDPEKEIASFNQYYLWLTIDQIEERYFSGSIELYTEYAIAGEKQRVRNMKFRQRIYGLLNINNELNYLIDEETSIYANLRLLRKNHSIEDQILETLK